MFGMSLTEILVVLVLLLVVVGPEKLPEMARTVGGWLREIRRATNMFQNTMMLEAEERDSNRPDQPRPPDEPIDIDQARSRESAPMLAVPLDQPAPTDEMRSVELPAAAQTNRCRRRYLSPPHRTIR